MSLGSWTPVLVFTLDDVLMILLILIALSGLIMVVGGWILTRIGEHMLPPTYTEPTNLDAPVPPNNPVEQPQPLLKQMEAQEETARKSLFLDAEAFQAWYGGAYKRVVYEKQCQEYAQYTGYAPEEFPYTYSEWLAASVDAYQNRLDAARESSQDKHGQEDRS